MLRALPVCYGVTTMRLLVQGQRQGSALLRVSWVFSTADARWEVRLSLQY